MADWDGSSGSLQKEPLEIAGRDFFNGPDALPVTQRTLSKHNYFHADDVLWRRVYHFVTMCLCVRVCWVCMFARKTKTPDRNNLKPGTVAVLGRLSKPTDFGFKRSRVKGTGSSFLTFGTPLNICGTDATTKFNFCAQVHHGGSKTCGNAASVTEYFSLWKIYPHLHNEMKTRNGISASLRTTVGP